MEETFWGNARYSRSYTTTVQLDGSGYSIELSTFPGTSVRKTELGSVLVQGWIGEGRTVSRRLQARFPIRSTELVGLVCLLFQDGWVEGPGTVEDAVGMGLSIASADPDLRRLADAVVNEPLLLIESSPARKATLASAAVATAAGIAVIDTGTFVALVIALGSGGVAVLRSSPTLQAKVDELFEPLDASIAKIRELEAAGQLDPEEAQRQVNAVVSGWAEKRSRRA